MSETLSKREIERRVSAVSSTGLTVSGVRFLPDGSMLVETAGTIRAANGADDAEALYLLSGSTWWGRV